MNNQKDINLLNDLQGLLDKQIESAKQGNTDDVNSLIAHADLLAGQIRELGILNMDEYKEQRAAIRRCYGELSLVLTAQKAAAEGQIKRIHRGRKTIEAYRNK